MTSDERDIASIKSAVRILCIICAGDEDKTIDILTGYLWDEDEAGDIKRSDGNFKIM